MLAYKIKEGVYWVGAIDWNMRSFHGYSTSKGSTYNAYLIIDENITLIDSVKESFADEMIARISSVIDPAKIEVIISNHGEPDHSGSIPKVVQYAPNAKVYSSSPNGVKILKAIFGSLPLVPVKTGDSISIGKRTLKFIQAPMVHWPDNMVTYDAYDKILYSNDIFGQHYATSKIFDYENNLAEVIQEAKKYYANIVLPYTNQANKIFNAAGALDFEFIAPSHGVVFKNHLKEIMALYEKMTNSYKEEKAVIVYDSMYGSTEKMAQSIASAFVRKNITVKFYNINDNHESDILTEISDCKYLAVGSPTINNCILSPIASFLSYLKGLSPKNLKFIAFGCYGWGGQSADIIDQELEAMKFERLIAPIKHYYVPQTEDLQTIEGMVIQALN